MAGLREICTLALLATAICMVTARPAKKDKTTYVLALFGDSLTDTGNTLRAAGVPDPTVYTDGTYKGRFCDGRNWVDYLSATLSKKNRMQVFNYAYGAATACPNAKLTAVLPYVKVLSNQTGDFVADVKSGKIPAGKDITLLPIMWIGSNDLLNTILDIMRNGGGMPSAAQVIALIKSVISCSLASIQNLAFTPGVKNVVMLPVSPLHTSVLLPASLKDQIIQLEDVLADQTAIALANLQAGLDTLPAGSPGAGVRLHLIGDYTWIERGMKKIKPPFKNITSPCFVNPVASMVITPGIKVCANPSDHLFFDESHPTSRFHEWFALKGLLPRLQQLRLLPTN